MLRGLAILAVVSNHAVARGFIAMFWWVHRYRPVLSPNYDQVGTWPYYILVAIQQLAQFCIPAFLFISGFFVAYAARGNPPTLSWKVVWARIKNLLEPYLTWSVIFYLVALLEGKLLGNGKAYSLLEFFRRLAIGSVVPPYFFVPLLCQFYLLSPIIVWFAKSKAHHLLFVFACLQLTLTGLSYLKLFGITLPSLLHTSGWLFVHWAFFFPLGVVCGFHYKSVQQWLTRFKWPLFVAVIVLGMLSVVESEVLYRLTQDYSWARGHHKLSIFLYGLAFILFFLSIDTRSLPFTRAIEQAGSQSYGIYLLHVPVQNLVARGVYHIAPLILTYQIFFQPLLMASSLIIPLLLMASIMNSPAKRYYHHLFG